MNSDPVTSPSHYTHGGIETIDYIRAKMPHECLSGYYLGNVLKYVSRAGHKTNAVEDLRKASVYLNWLIDHCSKEQTPA